MKRTTTCFVLAALMLVAMVATGQEKLGVAESMKWLPDGLYKDFGNYNLVELKKQPSYTFFKMLMNEDSNNMFGEAPPLPKSFEDKIEYISYGRSLSVGSSEEDEQSLAAFREKKRALEEKFEKNAGKATITDADIEEIKRLEKKLGGNRNQLSLWVYKIFDLDELMAKEIKSGFFAPIGKRLYKKPVYTFNEGIKKGKATGKSGNFIYATDTGELLVCSDYETLKSMIKSGLGTASNMFDNQEYINVVNFLSNRGQAWKVEPKRYLEQKSLDKLRESTPDNEEKIAQREEAMAKAEVFKISNMVLTEDVTMQSISVYNDSDAAEAYYKTINSTFKEASKGLKDTRNNISQEIEKSGQQLSQKEERMVKAAMGFAGNLLESQQTILEDSVVTTSIVFGKKRQKTLSMLMTFAKMMEDKEEAKEKREEEAKQNN